MDRELLPLGIRLLVPLVGDDLTSVRFCPSAVTRERRLARTAVHSRRAVRPIRSAPTAGSDSVGTWLFDSGRSVFKLVMISFGAKHRIGDPLELTSLVDTTALQGTYP